MHLEVVSSPPPKVQKLKQTPLRHLLVILWFSHILPVVAGKWRIKLNSQWLVSSLEKLLEKTEAKISRHLTKGIYNGGNQLLPMSEISPKQQQTPQFPHALQLPSLLNLEFLPDLYLISEPSTPTLSMELELKSTR